MRHQFAMIGLLVTAVMAVVAWAANRDAGSMGVESEPERSVATAGNSEQVGKAAERNRSVASHLQAAAIPSVRSGFEVPESFLPSGIASATRVVTPDKLMALTEQDKAWLAKHGFPTLTEVEWSRQATLEELRAAAKLSVAMAALYGERLWEQRGYDEGKSALKAALVQGSVYAAEAIALKILAQGARRPDGSNAAAFEAAAWMYYASLLGDYRVASDLSNHFGDASSWDLNNGLLRSFEIAAEIDAARAAIGLPPLRRDVRPSLDVYLESYSHGETTVVPR
ncbi:hypothetical protein [Tahibacter soli]|uniref:Sel1 repeat family protein n=1 Tax=Tahibacter soli TaxID=2983605 RepID=A0A9X3YQ44_9GAMM|nr:hypothetical protein [Tahibacter soli]MDC8014898.1 hypothetical protein [Tahibacter soli]